MLCFDHEGLMLAQYNKNSAFVKRTKMLFKVLVYLQVLYLYQMNRPHIQIRGIDCPKYCIEKLFVFPEVCLHMLPRYLMLAHNAILVYSLQAFWINVSFVKAVPLAPSAMFIYLKNLKYTKVLKEQPFIGNILIPLASFGKT